MWKPSEEERGRIQAREIDIPPVYAEVLKTCGFEIRNFDFNTAPDWIRCISTILQQLEDVFAIEPTSKRVVLAASTRRLNLLIAGLNFMLSVPEVRDVITKTSLSAYVVPRYIRRVARHRARDADNGRREEDGREEVRAA